MESNATSPPTRPRARVWQDWVAEGLLAAAVAVIALTGVNSFVLEVNLWLARVIPAYDPMVTMLVLVIVVIAALILGSIRLKISARRTSEATPLRQPARPPHARPRRTLPYLGP
jgi:hypothetical protein